MKKKHANLIIGACLGAIVTIFVVTWILAPLIVYGMFGLMFVGMVYGGYMNRAYIRAGIRKAIIEWKQKQLD